MALEGGNTDVTTDAVRCQAGAGVEVVSSQQSGSDNLQMFSGLTVCVTGLSKSERGLVSKVVEANGGAYSSDFHPLCTHLVACRAFGSKYEHALKHGAKRGLHVVSLAWLLSSLKSNRRECEADYHMTAPRNRPAHANAHTVSKCGGAPLPSLCEGMREASGTTSSSASCSNRHQPPGKSGHLLTGFIGSPEVGEGCGASGAHPQVTAVSGSQQRDDRTSGREHVAVACQTELVLKGCGGGCSSETVRAKGDLLSSFCFFIDPHVPLETRRQIQQSDQVACSDWLFAGGPVTHVVSPPEQAYRYLARGVNIVSPQWLLRNLDAPQLQGVVQYSADISKCIAKQVDPPPPEMPRGDAEALAGVSAIHAHESDRKQYVLAAKAGVRRRRGLLQKPPCRSSRRWIVPSGLLQSISWSITDEVLTASAYVESCAGASGPANDGLEEGGHGAAEAACRDTAELSSKTRPLKPLEFDETVFKGAFITILFPMDSLDELGPCSRSFVSDGGFTTRDLLLKIFDFYQEELTSQQVSLAVHTDSGPADALREAYASHTEHRPLCMKKAELLGSRLSFEGLLRVTNVGCGSLYELQLRS